LSTFLYDPRIARVQRTLERLEDDARLVAMRVKDLSPERQASAKSFAASVIDQTRAELARLIEERTLKSEEPDYPCEPAD
jgi:uncharacterized coiled-coil protein SlyX